MGFLKNRNFILPFGIVMGFFTGEAAEWADPLILPLLGFIMTLSTTQISLQALLDLRRQAKGAIAAVMLNYVLFGGVILLSARLLFNDEHLWQGFVILAAAPPAVAIIPFTAVLAGNLKLSMAASIGGYLASLLIAPAMAYFFLGENVISPWKILLTLGQLIIIPFVLSRILLKMNLERAVKRWRGVAVNWAFAVVLFTVVGLNRSAFLQEKAVLLELILIGFICSFGLGFLIDFSLKKLQVSKEDRTSYILLSTLKNAGFAAGVALAFLEPKAAIPSAIMSIYLVLYFMYLGKFRQG